MVLRYYTIEVVCTKRMVSVMEKKMSPEALEILDGLQEALCDAKGMPVEGLKKTVVYPVDSKIVRESLTHIEPVHD